VITALKYKFNIKTSTTDGFVTMYS